MAQQKYWLGSTGPHLYDDTNEYDGSVPQTGFRTTQGIRSDNFVAVGLVNPAVIDQRYVELGGLTGTDIWPNANYRPGKIECFTETGDYGMYITGANGSVTAAITIGNFGPPGSSGDAYVRDTGSYHELFNDRINSIDVNSLLTRGVFTNNFI